MNLFKRLFSDYNFTQSLRFYLFALLLLALFSLFLRIPYFSEINTLFLDRLQGSIRPRDEILIVGIDDKSLSEIGAWPWGRDVFAKAFDFLIETKPKVVGVDVLFLEKREKDEVFSEKLKNINFPLVLASKLVDEDVLKSIFAGGEIESGYINFEEDSDGKIRRIGSTRKVGDLCEPSFAFKIVKEYLSSREQDKCGNLVRLDRSKVYKNDLKFNYTDLRFKTVSFSDLYNGKIEKGALSGKIVLVGSTAVDLKSNLNDNFTDVFGRRIPGIEVHANVVNSFLQGRFQEDLSPWVLYPLVLLFSFLLLFLFRRIKKDLLEFVIFLGLLLVVNLIGLFVFDFGVSFPFVQINILFAVVYVYFIAYKYLVESREKRFIQKAFAQYVNPPLLKKLVEHHEALKLGGEQKVMTVLFSDIRGFTTLSEKMTPEELINLVNDYLDNMCEVILSNNGTIDKFIGDAIMAFWNAPLDDFLHQMNAVKTAVRMDEKLKKLSTEDERFSDLHIGVGLNTGTMVVGNVGSRRRFDYTVLGDNVNLGSRLEGLTKKYGVSVIVSESVLEGISADGEVIFRMLDEVIVKGKSKPVKIYQPLLKNEENEKLKKVFEEAFSYYQKGDFKKAEELFGSVNSDPASHKMIERISEIKDLKDWNGVWTWLEK
ncbi:hypothetical protein A2716_04440 [candidate division WWE3 bacterium RIFCSPHIGHO2_01_FULL_40_23]|uniref:Guanylate cyclase domain-containing protein n=1 Tax=candidate division WWE3 bacterium RIFCSPLOWO2_01_FULL_41_18 TaxID=1802625 RepID=A0A1F4VCZ7_UNCKA|nr:MAG: hypothetical protein A2716_04440 [candidate division WWE3 bacterium RIFCSPHIGHO2_01_FULL_40_23]OGC55122.1 MAG: hypothetical protein A3A78_04050 [candidate division WWE3 bacterium RIFCSPLOWO2_01_FULL_41_18]